MLWEDLVPHMVASRLLVLRHLHSIMTQIFMGSIGSVCTCFTEITIDVGYDPLGFLPEVDFGKQFQKLFVRILQSIDIMQGHLCLAACDQSC